MRIRTADLLKGMAVILMIQVHLVELFATPEIYDSFLGQLLLFLGGPPAAPVFMAVMGYFLAFSTKGLLFDVKRGFKLIIWGFALNIGLNLNLFYHIYAGAFQLSPWEYLFGVDILFLAGLSVIIIGLIKHFFRNKIWPWLALLFITIAIPEVFKPSTTDGVSAYFWAYFYSESWWSYFPVVPWLAYVLAGLLFNLLEENLKTIYYQFKWPIIAITAIVLVFTLRYGIDVSSHLEQYYHHGMLFFGFTVLFMLFWLICFHQITLHVNNVATNFIEWLGRRVTSVYIFQWLIIGNISTVLFKTQHLMQLTGWFLLVLILSSLASFTWYKIYRKS
ncbi:MAG: hypothetical protein CVT99_01995 [Bacteroidetes bacterium HGW-Bacteroidetes-16]|jgi:hypothetical protein|nr:MAG: hypothetical protein CVT99_01995 [Bacteroidetes bacterium HGW-Bacteroidetes-16]